MRKLRHEKISGHGLLLWSERLVPANSARDKLLDVAVNFQHHPGKIGNVHSWRVLLDIGVPVEDIASSVSYVEEDGPNSGQEVKA